MQWKDDWAEARSNLARWWRCDGLALSLTAPRMTPIDSVPAPSRPVNAVSRWTDAKWRAMAEEYRMATTRYYAEAYPVFETQIGPGSLGVMLGATPHFDDRTVWYEPCIDDPETFPAICLNTVNNTGWDMHMAIIDEALRRADGRYLVNVPDLIENLDTLAAMRGSEQLLYDLVDRPGWVHRRLAEITEAYAQAYNLIYEKVRDPDGGSAFAAFGIWGPGKTAKVQCDFSCMIGPAMFQEFFIPYVRRQCDRLDFVLYHLDGPGAVQHLDALLGVESITAIQWTPGAAAPTGGHRCWYPMYRHIRAAGKGVWVSLEHGSQVDPLIDAIGPEGLFIRYIADDEASAQQIVETVQSYRPDRKRSQDAMP
ncbi:MAG: hypothetical protein QF785_08210 [Phycisphaeraceae bacterium]|jgi:hypothetical protein|nr:hypothetical protein [Phycisphaeraceae bacterium]MDP7348537.1 hypothetical protein [Phycisphaeraceae bacterium]